MDLSERKFINNSKQCLPKFTFGLDSYYNTARQEFSRSIYNPTNISTRTLPESTMRKVNAAMPNAMQGLGKAAGYANAAIGVLGAGVNIANDAKPTVTEEGLMSTAKPYTIDVDGVQTEQYGPVDASAADVDVAGNATSGMTTGAIAGAVAGSVLPGVGTLLGGAVGGVLGGIGGLFGGMSKEKEQQERLKQAQLKISRKNKFNVETAQSKSLKMREAERYGNQEDQSLFHAAEGKEPDINPSTGMTYKNYLVNTAQGK